MISAGVFKEYINQSRPLRIHLADGREVEVPHGEYLSLQPGGRTFLMWKPRLAGFELFNLTMVTSIRVLNDEENPPKKQKK
jgi:hypothetical protein